MLFRSGRPATVELAVLVDRGGRTLPIAPTYTGLELAAGEKEKVRLHLDQQDPRKDTLTIQPA